MTPMYIRASKQVDKKTQRTYTTYRLVESYRNQSGQVRQQTLLNLGCHFEIPKSQWKALADRVEEIRNGQESLLEWEEDLEREAQRIAKLLIQKFSQPALEKLQKTTETRDKDHQCVDVNSLSHESVRKIGNEHVGVHAAKQLELEKIFQDLGFNGKQINIALGSIIGRLVYPNSELSTHRYLREHSGLDELLGTDFSRLALKNLYLISDLLLKHKDAIENALYERERDLFNLDEVVTLYDLTNTYFEGRAEKNKKAQYGRSKEKRNDCALVALGMVLDASGFPKRSRIYPGNVGESKTLKEMLKTLDANEDATIVMDAGIATDDNLAWLRDANYKYMVVSRKRRMIIPNDTESVIVKDKPGNLVRAQLVENKETDELELYCHSQAKELKVEQMVSKSVERYENELKKLSDGLNKKGCTKNHVKITERLGRLKQKFSRVSKRYEISIILDASDHFVTQITWSKNKKDQEANDLGIYCLRTNRKDLDAKTFWKTYTMLTELEAAFRSLKSELGFRPVYHQKESRVDGHLFISILAYHLLHTIRYQLKQHDIHKSWQTLRELLSTQIRITSTLKCKDGRTLKIRKTSLPDTNQSTIYQALNIERCPGKTEKTYF